MKTVLTNEFQNKITVQIEKESVEGIPGVKLVMEGPDSTMSNHITRQEAKALQQLLNRFLDETEE